jgi:ABC-2 type transport system ATP-binding protein
MVNSSVDEHVVVAEDLLVYRGKNRVLQGLTMKLRAGSITGLIGPSGCGKTTLLRSLVGVQKITSGTLTLLGEKAGAKPLRHRVAYTSQSLSVYRDISVRANVTYFARLVGASREDIDRALETTELTDIAHRAVSSLSGGQASRASLACALVGAPEVLILDEPTVGLDPLTRESLWTSFRSFAKRGTTLIVSSHMLEEATRCDEVLLMREGRFLAQAPIHQLQKQTATDSPEAAFLALIKRREQGAST